MTGFRAAAVFGWPAAHSRSPLIHGYWLAEHRLPGAYLRRSVEPNDFPELIRHLADHGLVGGNVTIPHKEAALSLADESDAVARSIGAANTLWLRDGRLHATNTDAAGFLANLDDRAPGWDQRRDMALVLGAGGSARAIVWALIERGFDRVVVANRTRGKAEALAATFGRRVMAVDLAEAGTHAARASLAVNTTALGMKGDRTLPMDVMALPPHAVVADIVYVPLTTPFLAAAAERGLAVVDGLGMLLHQAVPGFALWFGVMPRVTAELRALVVQDLGIAE